MCKKTFIVLLLGFSSFITSCVDNKYDLANKEISNDVKIEGNTVALPVGDLKAVLLDSLIDVSKIDVLEKGSDGVYGIKMDSTLSVNEEIEPITLNIAPIEYSIPVDFDKADIEDVQIGEMSVTSVIPSIPVSIGELNRKLPTLSSNIRSKNFEIPGLEEAFKILDRVGGSYSIRIDNPVSVTTGLQSVGCGIEYTLPDEIETIKNIKLGSSDDPKGTLVNVVVTNPKVLEKCNKELSFRIDFPENFHLAKDNNAEQAALYNVTNDGHSITLDGFKAQGEKSTFSFYVKEIVDVDKYIVDGVIKTEQNIEYVIDYTISGDIELSKGMSMSDFAFNVDMDVQLQFLDVVGSTKDIAVDFEAVTMDFKGEFDDLQYIDKIDYIVFNEDESRIRFTSQMNDDWLETFKLKEGYALKISFPEQLDINDALSEYDGKGDRIVYDEKEHAFYIKDLALLSNAEWVLALEKLTLDAAVENGKYSLCFPVSVGFVAMNADGEYEAVGSFVIAGQEIASMAGMLNKLNDDKKNVTFALEASTLVIDEAVVHTESITSPLNTEAEFKINSEVPSEIMGIEGIGFDKDVQISMVMNVAGVEDLDADIDINAKISLPSFLKLKTPAGSNDIKVTDNGVLEVEKRYNPSSGKPLELELLCSGMDFTKVFGFGGKNTELVDGKTYIKYDGSIVVDGEAVINGSRFSSNILDNDISFDVKLAIDEISVRTFHGVYSGKIDAVEEKIKFDLGEELDFLKDEGNAITLADPQLEVVVANPIGVPIDVALSLIGRDENGNEIEETRISTVKRIYPAEYDETRDKLTPVETKLFFTSDTSRNKKAGYENVEIENLANLLSEIPNSINLKIEPVIVTGEGITHHIDICNAINLEASYAVYIPLNFSEMQLCYNDTITGLKVSLDETMEVLSNVSIRAKADAVNTIPLGLALKFVPLDENDNVIDGLEIDELVVEAGEGDALLGEDGTVNGNLPSQKLSFAIKSNGGDLSSLDKLAMSVKATSGEVVGAVSLSAEQGLKLLNMVFEVSGDIETKF